MPGPWSGVGKGRERILHCAGSRAECIPFILRVDPLAMFVVSSQLLPNLQLLPNPRAACARFVYDPNPLWSPGPKRFRRIRK